MAPKKSSVRTLIPVCVFLRQRPAVVRRPVKSSFKLTFEFTRRGLRQDDVAAVPPQHVVRARNYLKGECRCNVIPDRITIRSRAGLRIRPRGKNQPGSPRRRWAMAVIRIGRSRLRDASRTAPSKEAPASRSWLANSTIRMPFLVASPHQHDHSDLTVDVQTLTVGKPEQGARRSPGNRQHDHEWMDVAFKLRAMARYTTTRASRKMK